MYIAVKQDQISLGKPAISLFKFLEELQREESLTQHSLTASGRSVTMASPGLSQHTPSKPKAVMSTELGVSSNKDDGDSYVAEANERKKSIIQAHRKALMGSSSKSSM